MFPLPRTSWHQLSVPAIEWLHFTVNPLVTPCGQPAMNVHFWPLAVCHWHLLGARYGPQSSLIPQYNDLMQDQRSRNDAAKRRKGLGTSHQRFCLGPGSLSALSGAPILWICSYRCAHGHHTIALPGSAPSPVQVKAYIGTITTVCNRYCQYPRGIIRKI